jgi:serine/threonine protein kinase
VVIVINVPIARPIFSTIQSQLQVSVEERFKVSLARTANRSTDYVSLDIIQEGNDPGTTTVTSRIATSDAQAAATVFQIIDSSHVKAEFASGGLHAATLISVQVTACVPGHELSSAQTCQLCPSNSFCPGGSSAGKACAAGSFSPPGAISRSQCAQVVFVTTKLPILRANFSADFQAKFRVALALTAWVSVEQVVLTNVSRRDAEQQLVVNAEIAVNDTASAEAVSGRMDLNSLNTNLMLQGLPKSTSVVARVSDSGAQSTSSSVISLPAVLGGVIGGFIILIACSVAGYWLFHTLRHRQAHTAFVNAVRTAKAGEAASESESEKYFPPDDNHATNKGHAALSLRMQYKALTVLGNGSRGCVVKATKKTFTKEAPVAIKIVVPKGRTFDKVERRRLKREASLLKLVTAKECMSAGGMAALHAIEQADVPQRDDACWFILELVGESLATELHAGGAQTAVGVSACIQAARDVLAALKVLHSNDFIHCEVTPSNIIHLAQERRVGGYEYKLIGFGKARTLQGDASDAAEDSQADEWYADGHATANGEVAYLAPELLLPPAGVLRCRVACEADMWSLGATMCALVSGLPPIKAGMEDQAPFVVDFPAEDQRLAFDNLKGLDKVIAKALKREPKDRYCSDSVLNAICPLIIADLGRS